MLTDKLLVLFSLEEGTYFCLITESCKAQMPHICKIIGSSNSIPFGPNLRRSFSFLGCDLSWFQGFLVSCISSFERGLLHSLLSLVLRHFDAVPNSLSTAV